MQLSFQIFVSVLEGPFLENIIEKFGKNDRITEILVRASCWPPDFDKIGHDLAHQLAESLL